MKRVLIFTMVVLMAFPSVGMAKIGKSKKKGKAEQPVRTPDEIKKSEYDKLISGYTRKEGMLVTYLKEGKLMLELSPEMFRHDYLLATRLASTSNTGVGVAGGMQTEPLCFYFTTDSINVYMRKRQLIFDVPEGDPVTSSFHKNFTNPIVATFKIKSKYNGNLTIDATDFFCKDNVMTSPVNEAVRREWPFDATASLVMSTKVFPSNVEILSQMNYRNAKNGDCITLNVNRSWIQLPDTPMKQRMQDNRVGYFHDFRNLFDTKKDWVTTYNFIHKWRLEPKDSAAYFRGELVEPVKPIVFYVDSAFPEKWRQTIIDGILDWNEAFEEAGFKNAIQARMYPKDDPDFDPDDMRYSCVKYATYAIPNAMGPSWVDPRSGEILTADVIWLHQVIQLVHNWRFVQTGAVDERVRTNVFPDDVMKESLRYVISHEIGHTLGLLHNMGASHAFPVEKLRDPEFTQKYGTTPSIMDYARNNYIAQPGDFEKGVKLTPPLIGVYDKYAINWGYRIIPGDLNLEEEHKVLSQWIEEKGDNPMYKFGLQQVLDIEDPTAQIEDLGDDPLKAGDYGISNLKIVFRNLEEWVGVKGDTYADLKNYFAEIVGQYTRYLGHSMAYVGGVRYTYNRVGEKDGVRVFIPKQQQRDALKWTFRQLRDTENWLIVPEKIIRMGFDLNGGDAIFQGMVANMYGNRRLQRIYEAGMVDPQRNYNLTAYLDDLYNEVFKVTLRGGSLSFSEMKMQAAAIEMLATHCGFVQPQQPGMMKMGIAGHDTGWLCGGYMADSVENDETSAVMRMPSISPLNTQILKALSFGQLQKVLRLYKANIAKGNQVTKDFYRFQIANIENMVKK